jgi:Zn-dependent protease with chaperone function
VSLLVCGAALYKSFQLRRGGAYVAESLGGRLLITDNATNKEKQLINIVEEMAIASGSPVPQVYVLEETGINAFAAGYNLDNAVIGVTRGCIDLLNRDQMQGVIAHEFSHIHHGDMRLNMKLVSILFGITMIGLLGQMLLRGSFGSAIYHRRSRSNQRLLPLALGLMAIGFGGSFFGGLIRSAVSRQREFLADASAVQFTRNPSGIAGALLKISRHASGASIAHSNSSEFSHFYFASGVSSFFSNLFATHPPLDLRISRVYPHSLQQLEQESLKPHSTQEKTHATQSRTTATQSSISLVSANNIIDQIIANAGIVTAAAMQSSSKILTSIPQTVYQACHNAYQARAVIYALLINDDKVSQESQLTHLRSRAHPATLKSFEKIFPLVSQCDKNTHFPLLQLCLPALKTMSEPQTKVFLENVDTLIKADKKISPLEWAFGLSLNALEKTHHADRNAALKDLQSEIENLLSLFARLNNPQHQLAGYNKAKSLLWPSSTANETLTPLSFDALNNSMKRIAQLRPLDTPILLKALLVCAQVDNEISVNERSTLQAVAIFLDTPLPLID